MIATIINAIAVIIGSLIGLAIGSKLSMNFKKTIITCAGITTMLIGISMALETSSFLIILFSLVIGGLLGSALKLEDRITNLGKWLNSKTNKTNDGSQFAKAFLNSSILFCAGSMSILGPIQAGTIGDYQLLLIKSLLDFSMAIIFAASYGIGTLFSFLVVLVYQGFFTIFGKAISPLLGETGLNELGCVGGAILILIAFNMLDIRKAKAADFIPALFIAPIIVKFSPIFTSLLNSL